MVYLVIKKEIIDVSGYDDMRRILKGGLILGMRGGLLVGGEDVLEIKKILCNLRVVLQNLRGVLRIWKGILWIRRWILWIR